MAHLETDARLLGRYRVVGELGSGGLSTAYRVWDEATREERALKLVDGSALSHLKNEFGLLAGLAHPRLIQVYDFGLLRAGAGPRDGNPEQQSAQRGGFYTARLLSGASFRALVDRAADSRPARAKAFIALCDALEGLAHLHALGIRHGDFKPENILVDAATGRGTLIDLSCAAAFDAPVLDGVVSGSPTYLAPELLEGGRRIDGRADLYAVGVVLRELGRASDASLIARLCAPEPADRPSEVADVLAALGEPRTIETGLAGRSPRLLGRSAELTSFDDQLGALLGCVPAARGLVIHGGGGMGKSRVLEEMKWRAQLRCDVTVLPPPRVAHHMHGALYDVLRRAGLDPAGLASGDHGLSATAQIVECLAASPNPTVLFIDDADALHPAEYQQLCAMVRSLPDTSRCMVVVTASCALGLASDVTVERELLPLSPETVRTWAGARVRPERANELTRLTGGNPAYVEAALRDLASGRLHEADLRSATQLTGVHLVAPLLDDVTEAERDALAVLVAHGSSAEPMPSANYERLAARGLLTLDGRGYRLARPADRSVVEGILGELRMTRAYARVVETLAAKPAPADPTQHVRLLEAQTRSGQIALAIATVDAHDGTQSRAPRSWSNALHDLTGALRAGAIDAAVAAPALLQIAQQQVELGRTRRALAAASACLRLRPNADLRARVAYVAASAYVHGERPARAIRQLRRALAGVPAGDVETQLRVVSMLARTLNQTGQYAEAAALTHDHLAQHDLAEHRDDSLRVTLLEIRASMSVAAMYLGDASIARVHLEHVAAELEGREEPRLLARVCSYLAILAFRAGDVATATEHYARALDVAERAELSDMLPTLVLNVGTARQQRGDWGEAMTLYERGHRVAVALGKKHARAILELNLANVLAEVGLADRAAEMAKRAHTSVAAASIDHLQGALHTLEADVAIARCDFRGAEIAFGNARATHRERDERREEAEAIINEVSVVLQLSDEARSFPHDEVNASLAEARTRLEGIEAEDVSARLLIVSGMCAAQAGRRADAERELRRAMERAVSAALPLTVADARCELAKILGGRASDDGPAATEVSLLMEQARRAWMDVAETLPVSIRDAFWRHPRRRDLAVASHARSTVGGERPGRPRRSDAPRLQRVLELGAQVSASLSVDRVLETAMDAAIELTGAERGFLLLPSDSDPFDVVVARNVDRRRLQRGELEFSTTIAEGVMQSGEAVLTLDARGDTRFANNRSVHAMRLKSVACVPVSAHGTTLGALYLDNRFEHGRFGEDDVGVVLAFAHHIAMALRNAQLHAALEEKTKRLEVEKRRVERLSRGQAKHIEELEERVRTQQRALEQRYDYAAISHRSEAMRGVLDVLDRVIDSDLTVLVEGESGTGKELIARAIHFNSPRAEAPFVSVNCGALSETLLESELFGHVRGAFTGADRDRDGLMVAAAGGTLLLDEVGELSLAMQVKLLRVLQEREVRPVGATTATPLDVRVVCATNRHLRDEVAAGRFREDLYYRVGVVEVVVPPLRERTEDILPIARAVLRRHAERTDGAGDVALSRGAARALLSYAWPGNVRQLENVLARAYVLSDRSVVRQEDLDLSAKPKRKNLARSRQEYEAAEAERIHATLLANRWNVSRTARALDMPRNTLYRKMTRLGLQRP